MNANPAGCDCERCEIDRERAPYQRAWLTAFREATTAQRWMPWKTAAIATRRKPMEPCWR